MDTSMNNLLKWSIENSTASNPNPNSDAPAAPAATAPSRPIDAEALQRLLGNTPSDAELMKAAMSAIKSPDVSLENKLIAFDNFEQLIENLDNANNMEVLGLWSPLVEELSVDEAERRKMAAWCLGTAVQNNEKAQERLLVLNPLPTLLRLAREDPDKTVRRKAVYAISSTVRNYQPALDELRKLMDVNEKADAGDMDQVDAIIAPLRNV